MTDETNKAVEGVEELKLEAPKAPTKPKKRTYTKKAEAPKETVKPAPPVEKVLTVTEILPKFFQLRESAAVKDKMDFERIIKNRFPKVDHSDCEQAWLTVAAYGNAVRALEEIVTNYHRVFIKQQVKGMETKKASRYITRTLKGNKLAKYIKLYHEGKKLNIWYDFKGDLDKIRRASRL